MTTDQAVEKMTNVMRRKHMAFASEQSYTGGKGMEAKELKSETHSPASIPLF
jgi:hypothetical protein